MENEPDQAEPENQKNSLMIPLMLGFTPALFVLAVFTLGANGALQTMSDATGRALLWVGCLGSLGCCFVSSFMFFRNGTVGAILGGILLLFINGFIAFFFGCCASIRI